MAEETQTLDDRVASEMAKITELELARVLYNSARDDAQRHAAKQIAHAILLSEIKPADEKNEAEIARYQAQVRMLANEMAVDAYGKIADNVGARVNDVGKTYKKGFDIIYQRIEDKLNEVLAEVDVSDKHAGNKAVEAIVPYLRALNIELTQEQADNQILVDLVRRTRISPTQYHTGVANTGAEEYFAYRREAAGLIKEERDKDGNLIGYKIDGSKLKKLIKDNVLVGSGLYTLTQREAA